MAGVALVASADWRRSGITRQLIIAAVAGGRIDTIWFMTRRSSGGDMKGKVGTVLRREKEVGVEVLKIGEVTIQGMNDGQEKHGSGMMVGAEAIGEVEMILMHEDSAALFGCLRRLLGRES